MTTTSISVEKNIRDKAAKKAKEDMLSFSSVVRILLLDYSNGKIHIGSQMKREPYIEIMEVDDDTQELMDDVVAEWNK
ncbi:MAG: hypothetical protein Q8P68_00085 [Candidatus Peregrinibacteria bacterium]|nr:hypothetical protein [Candidatus Peregrinibacteria bacterium]MDZ4244912.1 hypothetical protein [Candidatus Gracilibacteria bacterium]